jgi:type II secretory pathway pseudopilin PulG
MGATRISFANHAVRRTYQRGFTCVVAMFAVAILALVATRAVERSSTTEQRAREEELLWVGNEYRKAIEEYYRSTPGFEKKYPPNLQALLLDERTTRSTRPLRRLYIDPMTLSADWGIVKADDGGVAGVYSLATRRPLKAEGFTPPNVSFRNAETYQDWKFVAGTQPVSGASEFAFSRSNAPAQ